MRCSVCGWFRRDDHMISKEVCIYCLPWVLKANREIENALRVKKEVDEE